MKNSPVPRTQFDVLVEQITDLKRRVLLLENQHTPTVPVYLSGFPDDSILAQIALAPAVEDEHVCAWSQLSPAAAPDPRAGFGFAYDKNHGYGLLFGGYTGSAISPTWVQDTWKWTGTNWVELTPATTPTSVSQSGVSYPTLVWDDANQTVMMFYYTETSPHTFQTYLWTGSDWSAQTPATSPPADTGLPDSWTAGYSEAPGLGNVILFGGAGTDGNGSTETWLWDGTTWDHVTPSTTPPKRYFPFMAYDSLHDRVVMFGGRHSGSSVRFDTYLWDGTDWTVEATSLVSGDAADGRSIAFSETCGYTVRFGGEVTNDLSHTFRFDGDDWTDALESPTPPANYGSDTPLMIYDQQNGQIILFGGYDVSGVLSDDTWAWS